MLKTRRYEEEKDLREERRNGKGGFGMFQSRKE